MNVCARKHGQAGRVRKGQALVEMALVMMPLVILLFAIIDMGFTMFVYVTLHSAAREGVRLAAINDPATTTQAIHDIIIRSAPGLHLTASNITVTVDESAAAMAANGDFPQVTITVSRQHDFFGPVAWFGKPSITMTATFQSAIAIWDGNTAANYGS